jgi:hypothetical protein
MIDTKKLATKFMIHRGFSGLQRFSLSLAFWLTGRELRPHGSYTQRWATEQIREG